MKLYISTGNSRMEKKWNGQEMEFSVFLERLSHTVRTSETMEQYRKLSKAKQDSIKDVGGFVLGKLKGGRRKKANVLFRSGLTLDMDYATEDIAEQIELFFDFRCLIYSTHKHTPEKPRLRLIIPLSRTVSPDEYAAVARKVAEDIGMELFDDTTYEPSRLIACAKLYFERVYGIWSPTKFKDALLAVVSSERLYHPVKEYFSTLSWDGCSRIDSLLIDYMGAENTPYVRAVTRKTLVAAVARIYEPGIKFDSVLVLNGPQGCGKSTFFAKLGKEWYSDSLTISDMKDGKTAAEKLQGYWLLELGELAGIKKVDVETVKSFVTRTDDKYRQSYGTTVESHPRECVIVGSTNSEGGFLRDVTGNRRFWPVHVTGKGKHRGWDLTPETVDQIWAEAISIYKDGEELYLKGKEAAEAYVAQQEAMESDEREGIVEDYLERLLPADWDTMDLYQRRSYLGGGEFEAEGRTGTVVRERFCLMEVWCECFGKERQNFRKTDSYELESIIQKIGGWKKYEGNSSGKMRIPGYGVQRVFVRVKKETAGNK